MFINGKLAVDIGGVHPTASGGVTLDAATATRLGLVDGQTYPFDLFFAERQIGGSVFMAETSLPIFGDYAYQTRLTATDADAYDELTWTVLSPVGATLTPREGRTPLVSDLLYVPTAAELGTTQHFKVAVSDWFGGSDILEWDVVFDGTANQPPVANPAIVPPLTGMVGQIYTWDASQQFDDPDGDNIVFLASGSPSLPDGMTLTPSGQIEWLPTVNQSGTVPMSFVVHDNRGGFTAFSYNVKISRGITLVNTIEGTRADFPAIAQDVDDFANLNIDQAYTIAGRRDARDLTDVHFLRPDDDVSEPIFGQDFALDEIDGRAVLVSCARPMPLLLKLTYRSGTGGIETRYVAILTAMKEFDLSSSRPTTEPVKRIREDFTQFELILVSTANGDSDNGALDEARKCWPTAEPMDSLLTAVANIQYYSILWDMFGRWGVDNTFDVLIVDHGDDGRMSMRGGTSFGTGKQLDAGDSDGNEFYIDGISSFSSIISSITFIGCDVAKTLERGRPYVRYLAVETGITHRAFTGTVSFGISKDKKPYIFSKGGAARFIASPDGATR